MVLLSRLWSVALLHIDVNPSSGKGVDPAPAPRDVEQLELADADWKGWIDDQVLAERLKTEHRPKQQEGRSRRPMLSH